MYDNERLPPLEDLPPADHDLESRLNHVGQGDAYSPMQPEVMPPMDLAEGNPAGGGYAVPPSAMPPGAPGAVPPNAMAPGAMPADAASFGAVPPDALPADAAPADARAAGATPLAAMPMAAMRRFGRRPAAGGVPQNGVVPANVVGGPPRTVRWVNYVLWIVEILLAIRVLLILLAANPVAVFSGLIYLITWPIVLPFSGVFPSPGGSGHQLDAAAILAMIIYPLLAWAIDRLVELRRRWGNSSTV